MRMLRIALKVLKWTFYVAGAFATFVLVFGVWTNWTKMQPDFAALGDALAALLDTLFWNWWILIGAALGVLFVVLGKMMERRSPRPPDGVSDTAGNDRK